jgi:DDE superfamily endonuclease
MMDLHNLTIRKGIIKKNIKELESQLRNDKDKDIQQSILDAISKRRTELLDIECSIEMEMEKMKESPAAAATTTTNTTTTTASSSINTVAAVGSNSHATQIIATCRPLTAFGFTRIKDNKILPDFAPTIQISRRSNNSHCSFCQKDCKNAGGRASHEAACKSRILSIIETPAFDSSMVFPESTKHLLISTEVKKKRTRGADVRKVYAYPFKMRVIELAENLHIRIGARSGKEKQRNGSITLAAEMAGISQALVSKWLSTKAKIESDYRKAAGSKGAGHLGRIIFRAPRGPKPAFVEAECIVLQRLEQARVKRLSVNARTLKLWMMDAVHKIAGKNPMFNNKPFNATQCWLSRFTSRHDLVVRRATNKKDVSIEERLPAIQLFHKKLQHFISLDGDANDEIYGRFRPDCCFNMDQSPIEFESPTTTTYEKRGAVTVGVSHRAGADKRFGTLTILVRLDGNCQKPVLQPFPSIIFKGKGNVKQSERDKYAPGVFVQFQKNAWTDSNTLTAWCEHFKEWCSINTNPGDKKLLFLDNLKAQTTDVFKENLLESNIVAWWLPKNTTDLIQPVDRHFAVDLKNRINRILNDKLLVEDVFHDRWLGLGERFSASDCRILMTHLLRQAWDEITKEKDFLSLGLQTGCVMIRKGIDRQQRSIQNISITGLADYSFEHIPLDEALLSSHQQQSNDVEQEKVPATADSTKFKPLIEDEIEEDDIKDSESSKKRNKTDSNVNKVSKNSSTEENEEEEPSMEEGDHEEDDGEEDDGKKHDVNGEEEEESLIKSEQENKNKLTVICPSEDGVDDEDEIKFNALAVKEDSLDDTSDLVATKRPSPPAGYKFGTEIQEFPSITKLLKKLVYWYIPCCDDGNAGWIIAEISGGPPDPTAAALGYSVRLKCSSRLDKKTPGYLTRGRLEHPASFSVQNYGSRWLLLEKS